MFSKAKNNQNSADEGLVEINDETDSVQAPKKSRDARSSRLAAPSTRKGANKSPSVPSLISSDVMIKGEIEAEGEVQFDGALEGDIRAKGLVVGEGAVIHGAIIAEKARISGTVEGTIRAARVDLASTAVVKGDVIHTALSIENGARFEGTCRHSDNPEKDDGTKRTPPAAKAAPVKQEAAAAPKPAAQPAPEPEAEQAEPVAAAEDAQEEKKSSPPVLKSIPNPDRNKSTASFLNRGGKTDLR